MKKIVLLLLIFTCFSLYSQNIKTTQLGQATLEELKMSVYEKDLSAPAVVLYEEGSQFYSNYNKKISIREFYIRIKILKNKGLERSSYIITLPKDSEVIDLKGITYNLENGKIIQSVLNPKNILTDDKNRYITKYIVNFPNVKVGSVYELAYKFSENSIRIGQWYFQENIPKIKSKFTRLTPKTMDYIVNLIGPLSITNQKKNKNTKCFKRGSLKCVLSSYEMEDIPAFKEEVYMPNRSVLSSKLKFRLSYFFEIGYRKRKIFTKWSEFDSVFKPYYFDKEMTKERYFKKIIPDSLLTNGTKLSIAENIFHFLQDHYTWNNTIGGDTRITLRNNFKNKVASVDLIATTLYNALKGAGIECYYVAVSTKDKGPIDRELPNILDFNYTVVKAVIDGKSYFLDATDKSIGFGYVQPFASAKDGRVLDYTIVDYDWNQGVGIPKGSYWEAMKPLEPSSRVITIELNLSKRKGLHGEMMIKRSGYNALKFRRKVNEIGKEKNIDRFKESQNSYDVVNYSIKNLKNRDLSTIEKITFEEIEEDIENEIGKGKIRFKPILIDPFKVNPFVAEKRSHPIDFTYPRNLKYRFTFNIPDGYIVTNLPKGITLKLPENGLGYLYKIENKNGKIKIYVNLKITKPYFEVNEYEDIKKNYAKIIAVEKSYIELEKIDK